MPRVSVLMPCYNAAATLLECLDSIAYQTFEDYELVIVDDGSTDQTARILQSSAARDSRIRLVSQQHQGIVAALQNGLTACRSPLVARMDADDRMAPVRLEKQVNFLAQNQHIDLVSCLVSGFPAEDVRGGFHVYLDWLNSLITHRAIMREIFIESPFPHPSVMFRKASVLNVGGYQDHGWPEDYDLWLRMYLAGAQFAKIAEVLVDWREHPDRLTRADSRYSLENFLRTKAHYLVQGPLKGRDAVVIWGAGMMGRRISKHLVRHGAPLTAFVDVDPKKIGRTRRGKPIIAVDALMTTWRQYQNPVLLAAVGARGARALIRSNLLELGLSEGQDWWGVA